MESMVTFSNIYQDRVVWVSGHTGFKGAWLCEWLLSLGARVYGFSLPPPTQPSLFDQLGLSRRLNHQIGDVRHLDEVRRSLLSCQPDFVFHLAAQSLVRMAYDAPVETYMVNVLGTVHVVQALRELRKTCAAVFITSDKCYENQEWVYGYREQDPLGGHDPYSSSKAAAEIAISSFRRSFFSQHPVRIASARAGNVIGGGDWAKDRIVPDCIRALQQDQTIVVRNPRATRPWQHVLDPLSGYLWLATSLYQAAEDTTALAALCGPFNFGPGHEANRPVCDLVSEVLKHWPGHWQEQSNPQAVHEAKLLHLSTDKASMLLHWSPTWEFSKAVFYTVDWYRRIEKSVGFKTAPDLTREHIQLFTDHALTRLTPWLQDARKD